MNSTPALELAQKFLISSLWQGRIPQVFFQEQFQEPIPPLLLGLLVIELSSMTWPMYTVMEKKTTIINSYDI